MTILGTLRTCATLNNLHLLTDFVHSIGRHLELDDRTLFHLDLAVEEAAANVVQHAYPEDRPGQMELCAELDQDTVRLTLSDWGEPFDPRRAKPFDIHAPIETRVRGGMGLHFIYSLMDRVTRRVSPTPGAPNTLTLVKRIDRNARSVHDVCRCREIRLARPKTDDRMTFGTQSVRLVGDCQRRRRCHAERSF